MEKSKELKQFGKEFLLTFTAELIRQHGGGDFYKLKQILREELTPKSKIEEHKKKKQAKNNKKGDTWEEYKKSVIPEKIKEEKKRKELKELIKGKEEERSPEAIKERLSKPHKRYTGFQRQRPILTVPETRLPRQFQHLRPQPKERDIELEKLDDLVDDPNVREVECRGPGKNIYVKGRMGYQPTQISLSENEVSNLLDRFADKSQIPTMVGEYHVAVGDLTLTAQIKEDKGKSSFVITKLSQGSDRQMSGSQQRQGTLPKPPQKKAPQPPSPKSQKKQGGQEQHSSSQINDEDDGDFSEYTKSVGTKNQKNV